MSGIKKWLSRTFFSCIKQAKQVEPRRISENATHVEDVLLPINPPSNNPSVDIDTDHMKNEEEEDLKFPSFRHFVIISKESENHQVSDPEYEEFSFWSLPKESDEVFLQDSNAIPTTVRENISPAENTWLPIPSSKNTRVYKEDKEEDSYSEDGEEYFECVQVQIEIANRRKQYSSKEEEDGEECTSLKDLQINQAMKEGADEENVEDEFSLSQKDILQGRIKFNGRRSTSRCISMDERTLASSSCSSSQRQKKKVGFNLVEDCCPVPHPWPVSDRFRKAEILFSNISRGLRFKNRSLKVVAPSWAHDNAGISKRKAALKTFFVAH